MNEFQALCMAVEQVNGIDVQEVRTLEELGIGNEVIIEALKLVKGKFGDNYLVRTSNGIGVFLPQHLTPKIDKLLNQPSAYMLFSGEYVFKGVVRQYEKDGELYYTLHLKLAKKARGNEE